MPSCAATSATGACSTVCFSRAAARAIVHFAAESHVDRSIHGPGEFIRTNIEGTFTLLGARLLGRPGRRGAAGFPASCTSPPTRSMVRSGRRIRLRGNQRLMSRTVLTRRRKPPPITPGARLPPHLRPADADHQLLEQLRPYQFPEKLIPLVIANALAGKSLPIYGDGMNVRDWLYVGDHCAAIRAVLARGRTGETYNIGGWNEMPTWSSSGTICALLDELHPSGPAPMNGF